MNKLKNLFPPTFQRVFLRTDPNVNAQIRKHTIKNLNIYKNCDPQDITDRIRKLDQEWDTERTLEVYAAVMIFLSSYLGVKTRKYWFLVTGAIAVFMIQHGVQGWCPLLPFIRKWGVRTAEEIMNEKIVLKWIRGDFNKENMTVDQMLNMVEKQ